MASDARERARRQRRLQYVETTYDPLPVDASVAREYGVVAAAVMATGRTAHRRRAFDFLVAATARANELPLYTRSAPDFAGLEDLVEIIAV